MTYLTRVNAPGRNRGYQPGRYLGVGGFPIHNAEYPLPRIRFSVSIHFLDRVYFGMDVKLFIDMADVRADCAEADEKLVGDSLIV